MQRVVIHQQHPPVPPPPVPERKDSKLSSAAAFDHVVDEFSEDLFSASKADNNNINDETQLSGNFSIQERAIMYPSPSKSFQMHPLNPQSLMPYMIQHQHPQQHQQQQQHHQAHQQHLFHQQLQQQQQQQQNSYRMNRLKSEDAHEYASEEEEDVLN